MGGLAQLFARVTIDGTPPIALPVLSGSLSMDEEWIPYIRGTLVCPLDDRVTDLDPQAGDIWITVTLTRSFGRTDRIRDLSLRYAGKRLADITAQFAGKTIAAITRSLYHDYENDGVNRHDDVRTFRLMLREIQTDKAAATVQLSLASGEARLTDWNHMSPVATRWAGANLAAKIENMLALAGFTSGLASKPATTPTDAQIGDEALRAPGQSALEWLQQLTRKHDLMCWCDEDGLWRLAPNRLRSTVRAVTSVGDERTVGNVVQKVSRDEGWVTAVMLIYTWNGVTQYDFATTYAPNPERAKIIRYEAPFPGTGRAARMLAQLRKRGKSLTITAVTDPRITPGEVVNVTTASGTQSGRAASVQWQLAADEMTITLREVA
ncbi:hypothetical protein ASF87_16735 [Microbacterium sp. Leaf161]|uniref:hypothetical protein n=1 Tax=Microbacterium sp. Leaf161 TaxID=1736281 RepID=UPI0006F5B90F|nr:hypothetical protein [Microbacterium sp. Leaf161]KQR43436.1 hypothetical protein ASF87_16735 [Microbacterium sp. Leaf161]